MKTLLTSLILCATLSCLAQTTTNQSGGTTTTTGGSQNLLGDVGDIFRDLGVPTEALTNYGGFFYSKSLSNSKQYGSGALTVANVTSNGVVNFVAAVDRLSGGRGLGARTSFPAV